MRLLIIFFTIFSATTAICQPLDFAVQWGAEFKAPKRSSLSDIIGHDASGTYVIKVRGGLFSATDYTLESYDKSFRPVRSVDLQIIENGSPARVQHVLYMKGKILMFYVVR